MSHNTASALLASAVVNHNVRFDPNPQGGAASGGAAVASPAASTPVPATAAPAAAQPEQWVGEWKDTIAGLRAAGYTPKQAIESLRANGQPQAQHQQPQSQTRDTGDEKPLTKAEVSRMLAEESHRSGRTREAQAQAKLLDKLAKMEGLSEAEKEIYKYGLQGYLDDQRGKNVYADGHALRDSYLAPLEDKHFEEGWSWLESKRTASKAGALAAIGDAARGSQPATPTAGNQGGQGAPRDETKSGPKSAEDRRKKAQEIFAASRARSGAVGGSMSAAGA